MDNVLESVIKSSAGLIWKISKMFYGVEKADLYQAGVLGVIKAYNNYQSDGDTKFSTYAYKYIYGEMYAVASSKSIKVSKDILKLSKMIEHGRNILAQKLLRTPSNSELAAFLEIEEEKIEQALLCASSILSIDNESDDERSLNETIALEEAVTQDEKMLLSESLDTLNPLEKDIISARYYEDLTQSETARKLGITQVMVSRYESKSLKKMREYMYM